MSDNSLSGHSKRAILDFLKRQGPSDATVMAQSLEISPMATRQHLYALEESGFVNHAIQQKTGGRGRPSKLWTLAKGANPYFPDTHADLSVELIGNIREIFGERGLDKLIGMRTEQQIATYRLAMIGATTLKEKAKRLTKLRSEAGYLAELQTDGDKFVLVENHCPVCRAAQACAGLCRQELEVFKAALGPEVSVARTDHILAGARRCAYLIQRKTA